MGSADQQLITADEALAAETQNVFEAKIDLTAKAGANDREAAAMLAFAQAYSVIDSPEICQHASDELGKIKRRITALNDERLSETRLLDQLKQKIMNRYRPAISRLEQARDYLQPRITQFLSDQERKRQEEERRQAELRRQEQARLEAEARERKRIAEEEAARLRKAAEEEQRKAEAAAREQERQAEEARKQADAQAAREADARAAEIRRQAAANTREAVEQAEQVRQDGHAEANQIELTAAATPAPIVASTKIDGASHHYKWSAELDLDSKGIVDVAAHVVAHPEDVNLLTINWTAANQLAGARKEHFRIPGLKTVKKPILTNRGRGRG